MNKTNCIRTFFALGTVLLIGSLSFWGDSKNAKDVEEQPKKEAVQEKTMETTTPKTAYEYVIVNEKGYLTVYKKDLKTVYCRTAIPYSELDEELQKKIDCGYLIQDTEELYDFLENYSS